MDKKKKHGGRRDGAGRPSNSGKFGEKTKAMRVPLSLISHVEQWLHHYPLPENYEQISFPPVSTASVDLPLYSSRVAAGFPSPADDYVENALDLNHYLIQHKEATFFLRVSGESMINAGIYDDDILIVDRAIPAQNGKVVVAVLDGELTVKRLYKKDGVIILKPENPEFPDIPVFGEQELRIWGVVTSVIHEV